MTIVRFGLGSLALFASTRAWAACATVPRDYPNLQTALYECNDVFLSESYTHESDAPDVLVMPFGGTSTLVTITGASTRPALPRLVASEVDLELDTVTLFAAGGRYTTSSAEAAVYAEGGSLTMTHVSFGYPSEFGVLAFDADVTAVSIDAEGYQVPAIWAWGAVDADRPLVDVSDSTFDGGATSIVLGAYDAYGNVTGAADGNLLRVEFTDGVGESGADLVAVSSGGSVTVDTCSFTRSTVFSDDGVGGALAVVGADLTITNSLFTDTSAGGTGGAVYHSPENSWTTYTVDVRDSIFVNSSSGQSGGAISTTYSDLVVAGTTFDGTTTLGLGGAMYAYAGTVTVSDSTFQGFSALASGAIHASYADTYVTNSTFDGYGATTADSAGAMYVGGATLEVSGSTFQHLGVDGIGEGYGYGGAVYLGPDGVAVISDTTFDDTWAVAGGALFTYFATADIERVTVTTTRADYGGFAWLAGSSGSITDSHFDGTSAAGWGGWVVANKAIDLELAHNRVCGASGAIGTFDIAGRPLVRTYVHNNVFYGNASTYGTITYQPDADEDVGTGPFDVHNNTFVANSPGAGDVDVAREGADVRNNVFASAGRPGIRVEDGVSVTGGYDLFYEYGSVAIDDPVGALDDTGSVYDQDPLFQGDPATEGCDVNLWLAIGSPARDAGDPDLPDSFGTRSDIGAFGGPGSDLVDLDGDGFANDIDCADDAPAINPGAADVPEDGIDQDCQDGEAARPPDGWEPISWVAGGGGRCGCATPSGALPAGGLLLPTIAGLLAFHRRRR